MSIVEEEALLRTTDKLAIAEFYAENFAAAIRKLLSTPVVDHEHTGAVVRCKVLLQAYEAESEGRPRLVA